MKQQKTLCDRICWWVAVSIVAYFLLEVVYTAVQGHFTAVAR